MVDSVDAGASVRFAIEKKALRALYVDGKGERRYPAEVVARFFDVMGVIQAANDERDLRALKSLRLERLKGKRRHQHSMRLNDQWRLVLEFENDPLGRRIVIVDIEDYH
jgi:toxin HigB-1